MKWFLRLMVITLLFQPLLGKKVVIKLATLAPEGTNWFDLLLDMSQQWKEATKGEVVVRIYPNGVVGDERDMIRKMRIGQIQAGAISMEGLSEIYHDVYAFMIPLLFEDYSDVDYIRERIDDEIEAEIQARGFQILLWVDVGWAHWFSKDLVITPEDLKQHNIFVWAGDYRSAELWKEGGFNPIPLASIDVLSGLQTGLIDAIATTPLVALSQQWFGVVNNMLDMNWGLLSAAVVIDNRTWKRIKPEYQKKMLQIAKEIGKKHQQQTRHSGDQAVQVMRDYGLKVHHQTPEEKQIWWEYIQSWYPRLRGGYVSDEMFDRVLQLKAEKDSLDLKVELKP